jgi:hypothetical protein
MPGLILETTQNTLRPEELGRYRIAALRAQRSPPGSRGADGSTVRPTEES